MSEYWKSTPKYWCKYCAVYVRDTKLERANHESTGRHQNAIKRSLRELHRGHEREEREKERAKREIDRLNGVVSSGAGGASVSQQRSGQHAGGASGSAGAETSANERQQQLEQLADMGVAIPDGLRANMAMAGEWTVTSSRVVDDADDAEANSADGAIPLEATAKGIRKREHEKTEEEQEEENAVKNLFKKPKRWGRDTKRLPGEDDAELEALLSGELPTKSTRKEEKDISDVKQEEPDTERRSEVKEELALDDLAAIKQETGEKDGGTADLAMGNPDLSASTTDAASGALPGGVTFKKRKVKDIRHR